VSHRSALSAPFRLTWGDLRNIIAQCKCPRMRVPWTRGQASNIFASWVDCYLPWSTVRAWHPGRDLERIYSMCSYFLRVGRLPADVLIFWNFLLMLCFVGVRLWM